MQAIRRPIRYSAGTLRGFKAIADAGLYRRAAQLRTMLRVLSYKWVGLKRKLIRQGNSRIGVLLNRRLYALSREINSVKGKYGVVMARIQRVGYRAYTGRRMNRWHAQ